MGVANVDDVCRPHPLFSYHSSTTIKFLNGNLFSKYLDVNSESTCQTQISVASQCVDVGMIVEQQRAIKCYRLTANISRSVATSCAACSAAATICPRKW